MSLTVVSRAEWDARPPKSKRLLATISLKGMGLHYSAAEADQVEDPNDCPARVRGIQRYHMETNGWADIAYSFLVCHHGTIYEGRGWDVRTAANGTNKANDYWLAVCFLGADKAGRDDVTEPGRRSIRAVCHECERRYPNADQHKPHSFFKATACPGDELRSWLARGMPLAAPTPPKEVSPMFSPPIEINGKVVAVLKAPGGGLWMLTEAGAIYAWECPDLGAPNRHPEYWGDRKAARLEPLGDGYTVVDSTGARYDYG